MTTPKKALFLIDGVHKPDNTVSAVKDLCGIHNAEPVSFLWIGGTEKIESRESFSGVFREAFGVKVNFPRDTSPGALAVEILEAVSSESGINSVIQLSGAPQVTRAKTARYASAAVSAGAEYIAGATVLREYRQKEKHEKPSLGIYATDKRVGKTAFGSYVGCLFCGIKGPGQERKPVIITHSRGGPELPPLLEIYREKIPGPVEEMGVDDILSSRFRPEYLGRLLDFGLHGASDAFEDAMIISAYLDQWEETTGRNAPYISLIGCRRAGAGYFNEFVVSNAAEGVLAANRSPAEIIIHEGSGAEHPPVDVDEVLFLIPSDIDPRILEDFPGIEKSSLFVFANCQKESSSPEEVSAAADIIRRRRPEAEFKYTRFQPEVVGDTEEILKGKKAVFFTTAPDYILEKLQESLEETYGCSLTGVFNNLDNDEEMKKAIDSAGKNCDIMLFEIKARGVEGAVYAEKNLSIPYLYVNNVPVEVDSGFTPLGNNRSLESAILNLLRG